MSSGMVSRWPVLVSLPVADSDRGADGRLTEPAVERLFAQARAAFAKCATVDDSTLELRESTVQPGTASAGDGVTVSVAVVEVFPDRFTMEARLRPRDREDDQSVSSTASIAGVSM